MNKSPTNSITVDCSRDCSREMKWTYRRQEGESNDYNVAWLTPKKTRK